jgi:LmbE family N-acetylglucosaminyl deacetylase
METAGRLAVFGQGVRAGIVMLLILTAAIGKAQQIRPANSAKIYHELRQLNQLANVLYVAAHPDDENTRLLAWLENECHVRTAYLSLTRGDGGQNLLGTEQGDALGLIRTHELLEARNIDGAEQFFTRAVDFGFSKSYTETFRHWDRDTLTKDAVWVMRQFKPDIVICRFPPDSMAGHGQHAASAIIAADAFAACGDGSKYSDQLQYFPNWSPTRLLFNAYRFGTFSTTSEDMVKIEVGQYEPLLGMGTGELAGASRSVHKSQGEGTPSVAGTQKEYFKLLAGKPFTKSIFDGMDMTWGRIDRQDIGNDIKAVIDSFSFVSPQNSVYPLLRIRNKIENLPESYWKAQKLKEINKIILDCIGFQAELTCNQAEAIAGDTVTFTLQTLSRNPFFNWVSDFGFPASDTGYLDTAAQTAYYRQQYLNQLNHKPLPGSQTYTNAATDTNVRESQFAMEMPLTNPDSSSKSVSGNLPAVFRYPAVPKGYFHAFSAIRRMRFKKDSLYIIKENLAIPSVASVTQPYWLSEHHTPALFTVADRTNIGMPEAANPLQAIMTLHIDKEEFNIKIPLSYKKLDPLKGDMVEQLRIVPEMTMEFSSDLAIVNPDGTFSANCMLHPAKDLAHLNAYLCVAASEDAAFPSATYVLDSAIGFTVKKQTDTILFTCAGKKYKVPEKYRNGFLTVHVAGANNFGKTQHVIKYDHIPTQQYFTPTGLKLVAKAWNCSAKKIGYIEGAGDKIPAALRLAGLQVDILKEQDMTPAALKKYDAIVSGIRAVNVEKRMVKWLPILFKYAENGGTLIMMYNTLKELSTTAVGPYPITLSGKRVTEEDAAITILDTASRILKYPNKISADDFKGWVQERGLYFPSKWDDRYKPLFSMHDAGEPPLDGAVLFAKTGKGYYIYTSLSFSRQVPAGNVGAVRLLMNMLSIGK